jgi:hypothetical protein
MATPSANGDRRYKPDGELRCSPTAAIRKGIAMPCAPLAVEPVTATREEAVTQDTWSTVPATPSAALPLRHTAPARRRRSQLRHALVSLRRLFTTGHYDSKFERPDAIEDDYYRFRNQPRGY